MWRLLCGILPTSAEMAKKLPILDHYCVFCYKWEETDIHLFKCCKGLVRFWEESGLMLPSTQLGGSVLDWITTMMEVFSGNKLDLFFMHLWVI